MQNYKPPNITTLSTRVTPESYGGEAAVSEKSKAKQICTTHSSLHDPVSKDTTPHYHDYCMNKSIVEPIFVANYRLEAAEVNNATKRHILLSIL